MYERGYQKALIYGNYVEVYRFEKDLRTPTRRKVVARYPFPKIRRRDSVWRARRSFLRLVRANLYGKAAPCLLTLTMREVVSIGVAYSKFTRFMRSLQTNAKGSLRYIGVPEFQKRGAVHFHVLVYGFPRQLVESERYTRFLATKWAQGFIDVRVTDGSQRLAGYLSKYMAKAFSDERLSGQKAYSASRNVQRPQLVKGRHAVGYLDELLGVKLSTVPVLHESVYMTEWLGKVDYKIYYQE